MNTIKNDERKERKMMLKKIFSMILACSMVIGCLTACGNETKTSEVSKNESTETKVESSTPV